MTLPPDQLEALKREVHKETKELINIGCVNFLIDHLASRLLPDWQPIETAPKDGTDIYATRVDAIVFRPSIIYFERHENRGWLCSQTHRPVKSQPTHWMPLPQPPAAKGG